MGRPTGLIAVFSISLFWGCGCSAPGAPRTLSMTRFFGKPRSEKSNGKSDRIAKENPLQRDSDRRQSPATRTPSTIDVTHPGTQRSAGRRTAADRETLIRSMVDIEMKDASRSEREAMYKNVKNLDPAFARQVLSMNRLVRQMGQHAPGRQRAASTVADSHREHPAAISGSRGKVAGPSKLAGPARTRTTNRRSQVVPTAGVENPIPPTAPIGATPWSSGISTGETSSGATQRFPIAGHRQTASGRMSAHQTTAATADNPRTGQAPLASASRHDGNRPVVALDIDAGSIGPAAVGNPASDLSLAEWHDGLARLIARAETAAAQSRPGNNASPEGERDYIEKQVYLRMLYLMNDQRARSIEPIYGIDAANQEFWQQMFWAIAGYFDRRTIPDPRKRATETLASLRKAVRDLQPQAELKLANAAFCHKITSYGNYETFDRNEFRPGRPVMLYVEIENFASERTADNRFRTLLKSTIEIMDPAGNVLQKIPFPATEDLCRNYRRDYFHSYEFSIPQTRTIGFGPHKVRLTVQDEISGQMATYTLNFNVTGN